MLRIGKLTGNVYDEKGNTVTSGKVRTGYSADVNGVKRLISVRGDITGEGNVKSNDVSALMSGLTEKTTLSKVQSVSADYNFDGKVNNKDLVLKRYTSIRGEQYENEVVENKRKYVENQVLEGFKYKDLVLNSKEKYKKVKSLLD